MYHTYISVVANNQNKKKYCSKIIQPMVKHGGDPKTYH